MSSISKCNAGPAKAGLYEALQPIDPARAGSDLSLACAGDDPGRSRPASEDAGLDRDPSTVSRELKRNSQNGEYLPWLAQEHYQQRHKADVVMKTIDRANIHLDTSMSDNDDPFATLGDPCRSRLVKYQTIGRILGTKNPIHWDVLLSVDTGKVTLIEISAIDLTDSYADGLFNHWAEHVSRKLGSGYGYDSVRQWQNGDFYLAMQLFKFAPRRQELDSYLNFETASYELIPKAEILLYLEDRSPATQRKLKKMCLSCPMVLD